LLLTLQGDVDLSRSPALRLELLNALDGKPKRLLVDLAEVSYMDSSGVATLVEALQHQRRSGGQMILCALQPRVRSIFEIARLDSVFTIVDDTEQAKTI
jgi:anti-sigma B factor antagonist